MAKEKSQDANGIAARIKAAREQSRIDPAELRSRLRDKGIDLSKTGLHRIETQDPKNPNLKLVQAIAEVTNVSPSWILFGEGLAVPPDQVGQAIRGRVIDTVELMIGALDMTKRQETTIRAWLKSMRETAPKRVSKP